jgi:hypothetical protein
VSVYTPKKIVADVLVNVLRAQSRVKGNWILGVCRFFCAVFLHHELTAMFAAPSLSYTRLMKWANLAMHISVPLSLDTLFFGLFFADRGQ